VLLVVTGAIDVPGLEPPSLMLMEVTLVVWGVLVDIPRPPVEETEVVLYWHESLPTEHDVTTTVPVEVVVVVKIAYEVLTVGEFDVKTSVLVVVITAEKVVVVDIGTGTTVGPWVGAPENDGSGSG